MFCCGVKEFGFNKINLGNTRKIPRFFWHQSLSNIRISTQLIERMILENPVKHLTDISKEEVWLQNQEEQIALFFIPLHVETDEGKYHFVLGALPLERSREITRDSFCLIVVDDNNKMIGLFENKFSSLPAQFLDDEKTYEALAPYTYRISDKDENGKEERISLPKIVKIFFASEIVFDANYCRKGMSENKK